MRRLTWDEFRDAVGTSYAVDLPDESIALSLAAAEPLPESGREGGSFRLELTGPSTPILPQAIYTFRASGEPFQMFIVPIASGASGVRYEAIFY